jgi:hypothetical protein
MYGMYKKGSDNNDSSDKEIGALYVEVPINRNLSTKLFAQLYEMRKKDAVNKTK